MFALLLAAWGIGVWATMIRGTVSEIVGTYVGRPTPSSILVRHDALPQLEMLPMELMTFEVEPPSLVDAARLAPGERVRLRVRQRADGFTAIGVERIR